MASGTGIRDLISVGHCGADESERMTANVDVRDGLLNCRHVTGHTLAAFAGRGMLRVELDATRKSRLQDRIVTLKTNGISWKAQDRRVLRPVHVVAGVAMHTFQIHLTLHVVIPLHAVLVRGPIGPMCERCGAERRLFEFPHIR